MLVGIRNNPVERMEPCVFVGYRDENGKLYATNACYVPSSSISMREGRGFFLLPNPLDWFERGERVIDVFEVVCPDERFWEESEENFSSSNKAINTLAIAYSLLYLRELEKRGITDWEEIRKESYRFYRDPDWETFLRKLRKARENEGWWERMKVKFEELKERKVDTAKMEGRTVGWLRFVGSFEGERAEEVFFVDPEDYLVSLKESSIGRYALGIHLGIERDEWLKLFSKLLIDLKRENELE